MKDDWVLAIGKNATCLNNKAPNLKVEYNNPDYVITFPDGFMMRGGDRYDVSKTFMLNLSEHFLIATPPNVPSTDNRVIQVLGYQKGETYKWYNSSDDNIQNILPSRISGESGQTPNEILILPLCIPNEGNQLGDVFWNYVRQFKPNEIIITNNGDRYRTLGNIFIAKITE